MRPFNRSDIAEALTGFSLRQEAAFIASCAIRVSDFFLAFSLQERTGDISIIRAGQEALWLFSVDGTPPDAGLMESVNIQRPSEDGHFNSIFAPMAQYASDIVSIGLEFARGEYRDGHAGVDAAIAAQTIVEMYIATVNQVLVDPTDFPLQKHEAQRDYCNLPLFEAEMERQRGDILIIRHANVVTYSTVQKLRSGTYSGVRAVERFHLGPPGPPSKNNASVKF